MKAMVLAAGRGERMRPLTDTLPKPLLTVGGRPLIAWHLAALARAGIREVVVNLSWLGEKLRAALGDGAAYGVSITYSEEGPVALETGGGIVRALPLLGPEPFLVVSGDVWTDVDFGRLRLAPDAQAHLVLIPNPPHHPRGDFGLKSGWVVSRDSEPLTYGNVGIYRPEFFAGYPDGRFPLIQPLDRGIAAGKVRGELHLGEWCDAGTPARLAELNLRLGAVQ
jgi:N-acetyl-alpha-D-muramate 1-phosphate uridylyltransferase